VIDVRRVFKCYDKLLANYFDTLYIAAICLKFYNSSQVHLFDFIAIGGDIEGDFGRIGSGLFLN
jgi:hypothetical protein